ncbi:MAG: thiamine-phosphate kinase [Gammaproteobacteria bacterium]|nr:thiamine-phosphate kinase [Gammaproteobacteria bacterium]
MTCSEFDLIRHFFTEQSIRRTDVPLGIGDDAALLSPPADSLLAVSVDTLIAGIHFPLDTIARAVGYKALAVNLSDLAAMGAEPAWATLALTLPRADTSWLSDFAQGFFELASTHNVQLVGGDTTRGPLSITVQVTGFVSQEQALLRNGAQPGDGIFLTGTVGDAGLGLRLYQQPSDTHCDATMHLIHRLEFPTPRIAVGLALRGRASSAIDISDGLAADLGHVLTASGVGADIHVDQLPLSSAYRLLAPENNWQTAVSAGDDYELCFTLPAGLETEVLARLDCPCTRIGEITASPGLRWRDANDQQLALDNAGFDHFTSRKPQ